MKRLSCVFCVFAPKAALMLAAKHNPELFAKYVQVEETIGHRFRKELSLVEVQDSMNKNETIGAQDGAWNM